MIINIDVAISVYYNHDHPLVGSEATHPHPLPMSYLLHLQSLCYINWTEASILKACNHHTPVGQISLSTMAGTHHPQSDCWCWNLCCCSSLPSSVNEKSINQPRVLLNILVYSTAWSWPLISVLPSPYDYNFLSMSTTSLITPMMTTHWDKIPFLHFFPHPPYIPESFIWILSSISLPLGVFITPI